MPTPRDDPGRIEVWANPTEKPVGDFAFTVYDDFHPVSGSRRKWMLTKLRGWRGKKITFGVQGYSINWKTGRRRNWRAWTHLTLHTYSDLFGSHGAFLKIIKKKIAPHTEWEITVVKFSISLQRGGD